MHRRELITPGLTSAITPRLHSRAVPLAVIVVMITILGCGIGDWDRPVGKHGYEFAQPGGGIVLCDPSRSVVTPIDWKIAGAIEDDDWLLLELVKVDDSSPLEPKWMVVDMAAPRVRTYSTEAAARAALPARLQDRSLKQPQPEGVVTWLYRAACVLIFLIVVVLPLTLFVIWRRRRQRRLASDHPETPGWLS